MWPWNSSLLGPRLNLLTSWYIFTWGRIGVATFRKRYGSSWEISFGGIIGALSSTMWSKFAMIFWYLSGSAYSITISAYARYKTWPSTNLHLWISSSSDISQIGTSATKNYMGMKFSFPLRTDSLRPCRMNWRIKLRTIVPWPMNNDVAFYPPWRFNITVNDILLRSRCLQPLRRRRLILEVTHP